MEVMVCRRASRVWELCLGRLVLEDYWASWTGILSFAPASIGACLEARDGRLVLGGMKWSGCGMWAALWEADRWIVAWGEEMQSRLVRGRRASLGTPKIEEGV